MSHEERRQQMIGFFMPDVRVVALPVEWGDVERFRKVDGDFDLKMLMEQYVFPGFLLNMHYNESALC